MCIQKAPHCWTPQLYERYEQSISKYLTVSQSDREEDAAVLLGS